MTGSSSSTLEVSTLALHSSLAKSATVTCRIWIRDRGSSAVGLPAQARDVAAHAADLTKTHAQSFGVLLIPFRDQKREALSFLDFEPIVGQRIYRMYTVNLRTSLIAR
jgi:hypothetical protein